jgi:hypothetical protein
MAKAGTPKKRKAKPKLTDKKQSERFIETARELGVDESGKAFDRTFNQVVKPKKALPLSRS